MQVRWRELRVEEHMEEQCEYCGLRTKVDGWRWCAACGTSLATQNVKARKQRIKEEKQVALARGKTVRSLLSADHDEQIGGQSRAVRRLEDGC